MARGKLTIHLGADPFGRDIKEAIKAYLEEKHADSVEVQDYGVGDKYYEVANAVAKQVDTAARDGRNDRGILCCGTGMGMSVIANKYPRVYAAVCETAKAAANSRSINNANVLTLGGMYTNEDDVKQFIEEFLATTFTQGWDDPDIQAFLKKSMTEIPDLIGSIQATTDSPHPSSTSTLPSADPIFIDATKDELWQPIGGMNSDKCIMCRLREGAAAQVGGWGHGFRAICRFPKGAIEPPHHHSSGHDVLVMKGRKTVENITTGEKAVLGEKSFLFTPAGQVHRVTYHEDTEFYIAFDGVADLIWDSADKGVILHNQS